MIVSGGAMLPLDKVMPVLVVALPLKKDYVENETVFRMLFKLVAEQNPVVCGWSSMLLTVVLWLCVTIVWQ